MNDGRKHVVVLGAGFGGLTFCQSFRHPRARVTLVERTNHHLFQPLLYQVAVAGLSPEDVSAPIRQILARQANVEVRMAQVSEVDLPRRRVVLVGGEPICFDRLILAAGARTSYFGHDEWAPSAPGLKSIPDALEIRRRILTAFERAEWASDEVTRSREMTFIVVGGGPTGVELAGAIAEIATRTLRRDFRHIDTAQVRVILVEMLDKVLPPFPDALGQAARRMLEELGVEVRTGAPVEEVDAHGIVLGGERIDAGTVLWGAGVQAVGLTQTLGVPLDRGGRVLVEPDLSIPGHPAAFAVGDLCRFEHDRDDPVPWLAQAAMQQGRHAADNVLADIRSEPRRAFVYRDLGSLATIGRRRAVADLPIVRTSGTFAWLLWAFVHLWQLVGFGNRVFVFAKWAWAFLTWQRSSRVIWVDQDDLANTLSVDEQAERRVAVQEV